MARHTPDMWLAGVLKEEMRRLDLTQVDVASAVGVSQAAVSKWLSGLQTPQPVHVLRIAELVGRDPISVLHRVWPEFRSADRLGELRELLADASDGQLHEVIDYARRVVQPGTRQSPQRGTA